jgi:hypothetical protein
VTQLNQTGDEIMRVMTVALAVAISLVMGSAMAQKTDDVKWVDQCVRDSASYQVSEQIKIMYCTCMVSKMSDNETRSVTQWEQANPRTRDDCARRAGWH